MFEFIYEIILVISPKWFIILKNLEKRKHGKLSIVDMVLMSHPITRQHEIGHIYICVCIYIYDDQDMIIKKKTL